ncbi:YkgJ family cysteine cluster protein [Tenacibaculum maritimum]|uniref:YkgJ family cysteine cluster protein n=1 Tax=Tenacibaculum maritimum TaxID=107401 RepID=UPI0010A30DC7|nr:YkgJ family cysteine cluster protein [Tenacibaculum maritimum]QCD62536.1 zinc/iron-chelating domain-containing protein [Tenacibaculum maritimum]
MDKDLEHLPKLAKEAVKESKKYFATLKKRTPKHLDVLMQELHEEEFEKTDCLACGNCCKTTSPIFTEKDIERIAKHLRMKVRDFVAQYLERDADDFMVLKTAPCSFLDTTDNTCFIYDVRPKACAEYPHTDRRKFIQIADLTLKNTEICPATYRIVEKLKKRLPLKSNPKIKRK